MGKRVLVTGSAGLIGRALTAALPEQGFEVVGLDVRADGPAEQGDVRDCSLLEHRLAGCCGIVHLAAVSRVVWAQQEPAACWSTNVYGTAAVLRAALENRPRPWVLFTSSREVYGEPASLPVQESDPLEPVNVYGRSKVAGETMVQAAQEAGVRTAVVRLSNVYGSVSDHPDRVVPAFARAAASGTELIVEGSHRTFDFTHIDDVTAGLLSLVEMLQDSDSIPLVQLVTAVPTSLGELAATAVELAGTEATIQPGRERDYDVSRFYGSYELARSLLGWEPRVSVEEGLQRLINDFRMASVGRPAEALVE